MTHTLLWLYFASTFSYAHLPLAVVHHSLGSLFTYISMALLVAFLARSARVKLAAAELRLLLGALAILMTTFVGQTVAGLLFGAGGLDGDLSLRSAVTVVSAFLPLLSIVVLIALSRHTGFTFRHLAAAVRFALGFLSLYLVVEILGGRFELQPFRGVVQFVSEHLNYRDDLDILGGRVRGFSNEPSYLAVVVEFMVAIVLVDGGISDRRRNILLFGILALSSAALSKNILVGLVPLFAVHLLYFRRQAVIVLPLFAGLVALYWFILGQSEGIAWQYEAYGFDFSTLTRVGSWLAAWDGFTSSPMFGNGLGLAGKLLPAHYPEWFYFSPEADQWETAAGEFGTPVFSNLFRLLFEMGLAGIVFLGFCILKLLRISNRRGLLSYDNAILVTGFLVSFAMVDVLTFWPWYVALGIRRLHDEVKLPHREMSRAARRACSHPPRPRASTHELPPASQGAQAA